MPIESPQRQEYELCVCVCSLHLYKRWKKGKTIACCVNMPPIRIICSIILHGIFYNGPRFVLLYFMTFHFFLWCQFFFLLLRTTCKWPPPSYNWILSQIFRFWILVFCLQRVLHNTCSCVRVRFMPLVRYPSYTEVTLYVPDSCHYFCCCKVSRLC